MGRRRIWPKKPWANFARFLILFQTNLLIKFTQPTTSRLSDIPEEEGDRLPSGELIEVEGTRLKISKKLYKHAEKERKNALKLVFDIFKNFK
jgi:hypothetical protein